MNYFHFIQFIMILKLKILEEFYFFEINPILDSKWTENRILVASSIKLSTLNICENHSLENH
jgi:hypothetical protein